MKWDIHCGVRRLSRRILWNKTSKGVVFQWEEDDSWFGLSVGRPCVQDHQESFQGKTQQKLLKRNKQDVSASIPPSGGRTCVSHLGWGWGQTDRVAGGSDTQSLFLSILDNSQSHFQCPCKKVKEWTSPAGSALINVHKLLSLGGHPFSSSVTWSHVWRLSWFFWPSRTPSSSFRCRIPTQNFQTVSQCGFNWLPLKRNENPRKKVLLCEQTIASQ